MADCCSLEESELIAERPDSFPNPSIEVSKYCQMDVSVKPSGHICHRAMWQNSSQSFSQTEVYDAN